MQKKNKPKPTLEDPTSLGDDELLEFAEEVLSSADDEIINLDDDAVVTSDEDEEIIDLTHVSDISEDDEILDLTEDLEEPLPEDEEVMDLENVTREASSTVDAIMELDDAIDALSEQKEEILDLEEMPDESLEDDGEIIDLDEFVEAPSATDIVKNEEAPEFTIETDTFELTDSDREELEEEFSLNQEAQIPPDTFDAPQPEQTAENGPDAADTFDAELGELVDTVDAAEMDGGTPADTPIQKPENEAVEEIFELTDDDQIVLEEELGADQVDAPAIDAFDSPQPDQFVIEDELNEDVNDPSLDDTIDLDESDLLLGQEELSSIPESDTPTETLDLAEMDQEVLQEELGLDTTPEFPEEPAETPQAEQATAEEEIDIDSVNGPFDDTNELDTPEISAATDAPITDQTVETMEDMLKRSDIDDETMSAVPEQPQNAEEEISLDSDRPMDDTDILDAPGGSLDEEISAASLMDDLADEAPAQDDAQQSSEVFAEEPILEAGELAESEQSQIDPTGAQDSHDLAGDLGLDIEEDAAEADEAALDQASEGGVVEEPLSAEALTDTEADEDEFIESLGMTIESEAGKAGALSAAEQLDDSQQAQDMSVDFDQPEAASQKDLHTMTDPISIRVKEPAAEDHADEDELLNNVFEPAHEAVAPGNLEDAVERVVNKVFAQKIEAILVEAIEKAVTNEISRLKNRMLGDLSKDD
jgi:hypothetical protein